MGNYLANRRIELGLTQKEVAEAAGVTEATVSRWESGAIANMRRDKIHLLAKALNTTPNFVMTGEGSPEPPPKEKSCFLEHLNDLGQNIRAEDVYRQATSFDKPGTKQTSTDVFAYLHFTIHQYDEDIVDQMVTLQASQGDKGFRVPEELMYDQNDVTAHLIDIISYMPSNTVYEAREKLHKLLSLLNDNGIEKILSYTEGLVNNSKYRAELEHFKTAK